jgi:hypothetical protein
VSSQVTTISHITTEVIVAYQYLESLGLAHFSMALNVIEFRGLAYLPESPCKTMIYCIPKILPFKPPIFDLNLSLIWGVTPPV